MQKNIHGNQDIFEWEEVPVKFEERSRTDICCIFINSAFSIILFIICICMLNVENLRKMTYALDGEGNLCGYDLPDHPYLYYTSSTDAVKRLCVSKCPKEGDTSLQCSPTPSLSCEANDNPKYQVQIVDTELVNNRVGLFCMPTDDEERQKIEAISLVNKKNRFMGFYDAFWTVLWLSVLAGILYNVLMYFFPKGTTRWMFLIGIFAQIAGAFLILFIPNGWLPARLFAFFVLLGLAAMSILTFVKDDYRKQLLVCSELMECAVEACKLNIFSGLFYIILFICLFGILIVLFCFQILCVWSDAKFTFEPEIPFYRIGNAGGIILTAIIIFQFYWGMSFLKESFNFCVSGYATSWYYYKDKSKASIFLSVKLLVLKHWGSVLGGSFVLSFLYFPDLVIDFVQGWRNQKRIQQSNGKMKKRQLNAGIDRSFDREQVPEQHAVKKICSMTNLARSQSMAYINLIPIPYCNASRYCEYLDEQSCFYDRSQITNRLFRLASHIALMAICTLLAIETNKVTSDKMDIAGVAMILVISMFTVTYFICYFGDLAEGILISVFLEEHLKNEYDSLEEAPTIVQKLYQKEKDGDFYQNNTMKNYVWPKND